MELADMRVLEARAFGREGSTPSPSTMLMWWNW